MSSILGKNKEKKIKNKIQFNKAVLFCPYDLLLKQKKVEEALIKMNKKFILFDKKRQNQEEKKQEYQDILEYYYNEIFYDKENSEEIDFWLEDLKNSQEKDSYSEIIFYENKLKNLTKKIEDLKENDPKSEKLNMYEEEKSEIQEKIDLYIKQKKTISAEQLRNCIQKKILKTNNFLIKNIAFVNLSFLSFDLSQSSMQYFSGSEKQFLIFNEFLGYVNQIYKLKTFDQNLEYLKKNYNEIKNVNSYYENSPNEEEKCLIFESLHKILDEYKKFINSINEAKDIIIDLCFYDENNKEITKKQEDKLIILSEIVSLQYEIIKNLNEKSQKFHCLIDLFFVDSNIIHEMILIDLEQIDNQDKSINL
jgi:hypothetical protein